MHRLLPLHVHRETRARLRDPRQACADAVREPDDLEPRQRAQQSLREVPARQRRDRLHARAPVQGGRERSVARARARDRAAGHVHRGGPVDVLRYARSRHDGALPDRRSLRHRAPASRRPTTSADASVTLSRFGAIAVHDAA